MIILLGILLTAIVGIFRLAKIHSNEPVEWNALGACFFILALASFVSFCTPMVWVLIEYIYQGKPNPAASEIPGPILPAMTIWQFLLKASLPLLTVVPPFVTFGAGLACFNKQSPGKLIQAAILATGLIWIGMTIFSLLHAPSFSFMFVFFMVLPSAICAFFYFFSAFLIHKKKL